MVVSSAARLLDARRRLGADVVEQADDHLAVVALGPAADHPSVGPDGGPGVAVDVVELLAVRAEAEVAVLPAHRRRVERGQQRDPRVGRGHRLGVAGEHQAGQAVEVDLDGVERRECSPGARLGPAGPPLQVVERWPARRTVSQACAISDEAVAVSGRST